MKETYLVRRNQEIAHNANLRNFKNKDEALEMVDLGEPGFATTEFSEADQEEEIAEISVAIKGGTDMEKNQDLATTVWSIVGTALFASWYLVLGPLGVLLLLGVAYAMHVENLTLGIVCGVLLFFPVGLTVVWAPLCVVGVSQEQQVEGKAKLAATELVRP